jgi:hypothetical protein
MASLQSVWKEVDMLPTKPALSIIISSTLAASH